MMSENIYYIEQDCKKRFGKLDVDVYPHDDWIKYFKVIEYAAYQELKKQLDVAKKTLEFYANKDNWLESQIGTFTPFDTIEDSDLGECKDEMYVGGKRARETLEKLRRSNLEHKTKIDT